MKPGGATTKDSTLKTTNVPAKPIQFDERVKEIDNCLKTLKTTKDINKLNAGTNEASIDFQKSIVSEQEEKRLKVAEIMKRISGTNPSKSHREFEFNLLELNLAAETLY